MRVILFLSVFFLTQFAHSIEYIGVTQDGIDSAYKEAMSKPGISITEEYSYKKIAVPSERTTYYFTLPEHPAHPAVVIQEVIEENGAIYLQATGITAGDRDIFEQWLRNFEQMHERVRKQMQNRASGS
ncbi:hypothetical protein ACJJIR_07565 [Microbulbifer sp. SSSA008]|uniref:hypothetical protein n=1 Tax=Microbulbifer sp. SSSA008 TaxID=3243380 RepID=UPI00403927B2